MHMFPSVSLYYIKITKIIDNRTKNCLKTNLGSKIVLKEI